MRRQEYHPFLPPRSLVRWCKLDPLVRTDIRIVRSLGQHLVAVFSFIGRSHDPGIVTTVGQNEGHIRIRKEMDLMDRLPWGDMVAQCADDKHRLVEIRQGDRLSVNLVAT